ncbi:major capsid protein [Sapientia aquatica]|uniref:Major capsid protein n=1 Tax=Sapientia aquatica TaxID=1549640 RepID=A0A4R5W1M4_9BURK|nr:major capsid protein [Sapientia aquatica]TDK65982.1 major capsid protein [Sapientia aquatica]
MNLADLFTVTTLTDAINKLPSVPGLAGATGLFEEKGVTTSSIVVEQRAGQLHLVQSIDRNADPTIVKSGKRQRRSFEIPHLPVAGQLLPSELQDIAPFGADGGAMPQATIINDKLEEMKASLEATREWQRIGAIKGQILDADGSIIYDLYKEFDIEQHRVNIALANKNTDVLKECNNLKRHVEKNVRGQILNGVQAFVGADFYDALVGHDRVRAAFANWQAAQDRLGGDMRSGFTFGGITFIEYAGEVNGQPFISPDVARILPNAKNVFRMYNAPANYNETTNTIGLPFYAKAQERRLGKGWDLEAQSNPLALCLYPEALVELKLT